MVTGRDARGRSCVLSDGAVEVESAAEGMRARLWSLPRGPLHPESGSLHAASSGGCEWCVQRLTAELAGASALGCGDSLLWVAVLDGEPELVLERERVRLAAGDCSVLRGAPHYFRAAGARPCTLAALVFHPDRSAAGASPALPPRASAAPLGIGPRRVVASPGPGAASRVECDGEPPNALRLVHGAGAAYTDVWQTFGPLRDARGGGDTPPGAFEFYPVGGGACWKHMRIPPDAAFAQIDAAALAAEYAQRAPGMAAGGEHDPSRPGRHRTDSVDLLQVLSGRISLLLDEGEVELAAGDFAVQQGTWHAWSNRGDEPCALQALMIATGPLAPR